MRFKSFLRYVPVIAVIIMAAGFWYNWRSETPEIDGRILQVLVGQQTPDCNDNNALASFRPYVWLVNNGKKPIQVVEYELEVNVGNGFEKTRRVYAEYIEGMCAYDKQGREIHLAQDQLISSKSPPLKYGIPLIGWISFDSEKPVKYYLHKDKLYKLTCIDVFKNKYVTLGDTRTFVNPEIIRDYGGIDRTNLD